MSAVAEREMTVRLHRPHPKQAAFVDSSAKRIVVRAGRRGGNSAPPERVVTPASERIPLIPISFASRLSR